MSVIMVVTLPIPPKRALLVDAGVADTVLPAQVRDWYPGLVFLQDADNLLFQKRLRFMLGSSRRARANFKLN